MSSERCCRPGVTVKAAAISNFPDEVVQKYGKQLVLFGNLEATDIENLPTDQFVEKIKTAIEQGTAGKGRGFVLLPSSCSYGRKLPPLALANYRKMVEMVEFAM